LGSPLELLFCFLLPILATTNLSSLASHFGCVLNLFQQCMNWSAFSCSSSDLYKVHASATYKHQHPKDTSFMSYKNKIGELIKILQSKYLVFYCSTTLRSSLNLW
jgi:hypothetical protein